METMKINESELVGMVRDAVKTVLESGDVVALNLHGNTDAADEDEYERKKDAQRNRLERASDERLMLDLRGDMSTRREMDRWVNGEVDKPSSLTIHDRWGNGLGDPMLSGNEIRHQNPELFRGPDSIGGVKDWMRLDRRRAIADNDAAMDSRLEEAVDRSVRSVLRGMLGK